VRRRAAATVLLLAAGCVAGCTSGSAAPSPPRATGSGAAASPTAPAASPTRRAGRLRVAWTRWRLPEPVAREAVVPGADGASVVVAGGLLAGDRSTATAYSLDLRGGAVTALPDLATAVHDTAGVRLAGRTLVLGGGNASEQSVIQSVRRGGTRVRGHLPGPRSDLSAVRTGDRAYVVGGYDGLSPALSDVLSSRDGRRWRTVARLPVPVRYAAVTAAGSALLVFGGERNGAMVDAVQRVDPARGTAHVVAHLPRPLGHAAALLLGDRVLVAGGRTAADRPSSRLWWFDPGSRRFTRAGRLPRPLADTASFAVGSTGYLVGGETPAFSDRVLRLRRD
jgi:hypothetical protein